MVHPQRPLPILTASLLKDSVVRYHDGMTPHFIDFDDVRDRCIQLYSTVTSPCPDTDDPLTETYVDFYRYKISTLLLEIATRARVLDDILRNDESERVLASRRFDHPVARYVEGGRGELKLRECLNKIIHARWIKLVTPNLEDVWDEEEMVCQGHTGDVLLEGEQNGNDWTVRLSPVALCRELLSWLPDVEELGRLHKLYQ